MKRASEFARSLLAQASRPRAGGEFEFRFMRFIESSNIGDTMNEVAILFPSSPDGLREPDPAFQREFDAVTELGLAWRVFAFESLLDGDLERAFRYLPPGDGQSLIYRGWILKESEHHQLSAELSKRGYQLFTSTRAYELAQYLPRYFDLIRSMALPAVWTETPDMDAAWERARQLGPPPYVVKDHVKSVKERWSEACFVPADAGLSDFRAICEKLIEYRGDRFERGFVVRPFVPLQFIEESPFGYPIFEEYRLFFFMGQFLTSSIYDRTGGLQADFSAFMHLPRLVASPFFTADIGRTAAGELALIEMGDGGVSRLPPRLDARHFYRRILEVLKAAPSA